MPAQSTASRGLSQLPRPPGAGQGTSVMGEGELGSPQASDLGLQTSALHCDVLESRHLGGKPTGESVDMGVS